MALTRDKMLAAMAVGLRVPIYKASVANMAAGYVASLWRAVGSAFWSQGAIPGAAATPNDDTAGGIVLPDWGTMTGRVYRFAPLGVTVGSYMLYDRISHMAGLSGTVLTAQTVNLAVETALAAGRCRSDYQDVEWYVEIYTDIGTTAANLTITYTDANDTGSKTVVITGFSGASPLNRSGRCVYIMPTDGIAIKSIQSVTLSGTTGTVGSFGVTARVAKGTVGQMLANIQAPGVDAISLGLPIIQKTSCLELLVQCSTTSTGIIQGDMKIGWVDES